MAYFNTIIAFLVPRYLSLPAIRHGFTGLPRLQPQSTQRLTLPKATIIAPYTSTGILTRCPSPTLLSLGLGPTNPTRTDLPSETLDFRRIRFSLISRYSCQHSHFCTVQYTFRYTFAPYRTLPYHSFESLSSVICLSPVTLSAQLRLTSELLRTL